MSTINYKDYTYISFFTNNTYDIRGLKFINLFYNNKALTYEGPEADKVLKEEYALLFYEAINFIKLLQLKDKNYQIKWLFDFYSNFTNFNIYKFENIFINYDDNFENIMEIINKIDAKELVDDFKKKLDLNRNFLYDVFIEHYLKDFIIKIKKYLFSNLLFSNYQMFSYNKIKKPLRELAKFFDDKSKIYQIDNEDIDIITKINENINKKYALYYKILRNNNYVKDIIKLDNNMNNLFLEKKNQTNVHEKIYNIECSEIFLNMDDKNCNILLNNVLSEKGYGPYSKELFENDNNFLIYDKLDRYKKLNIGNMIIIIDLLKKLNFEIKIIYLKNKKSPKYIRYYENFENWEIKQNINKKLNKQPYLRLYLNTCIEIINRRVKYLNPDIEDIGIFYYDLFNSNDINIIYKKLINLINTNQNSELKNTLELLNNRLNNLITENNYLINNNYINNNNLIKILINNPSKSNSKLLASILNSSYKFHKSLFVF